MAGRMGGCTRMDACDYRHFLTATRQYHALWLGIHPEGLTGTGIELQACEDRRMAQTGYSKPFTILGFVSRRRTVVSYHPDFAVSIRQAVLQYDPIDPISSLRYGLETAFGVKASVGNKYYFAGCVNNGSMGDWFCPTCDSFYSVPWVDPFEWVGPETGPEQNDTLTADELGQLYRDITLGNPTEVVLDTGGKRRQFLDAKQEVCDIAAGGHIVETPE